MKGIWGLITAGAAAVVMSGAASSSAQTASAGSGSRVSTPVEPVVVELFTAQGCSGCPEANALLEGLAERPGVIALTYAVDYWDYLGWPDTFAQPAFAERQRRPAGQSGHVQITANNRTNGHFSGRNGRIWEHFFQV